MKSLRLLLLLLMLSFTGIIKADELVIQDFQLLPEQQTSVAVELNNTDRQYIMLDFFIQLPSGVTIARDEEDELMYELNSTRARRSHSLEIREQSNGSYRVLLYSSSNEALKGTSGAVFTMTLEADASATSGDYTGALTNQLAMDINKNKLNFLDKSFNVLIKSVQQPQSLSLENLPVMTYGDAAYTLQDKTDQNQTLTWSSNNTDVATVSGNMLTVKGAGTATITASQVGSESYTPFSKTFTLTVNKAALTVTADDCSKMEGAANPAFTISYSGFKYNDNASSLSTQPTAASEATTSSPAGTYPITVSGGSSDNYEFNYVNGTLTVTAKNNQTISLSSIPVMTYGDDAYNLPSATYQGLALTWTCSNTSVATVSGNMLTVKGAGEASVTAANDGDATHSPFSKTFTLTVNKAVLTVTADDCSRMEGAENPAFTISYSGFKYNDNASSLTTQPTASTTANTSSPVGTYPITVSGGVSDNYEFSYVNGTLTVTAKSSQTIQLTEMAAKTYGDGAETLPASTEQGLSLTWTSSNTSVATVSGNTLTVKGAGEATVTAANDGDTTHTPFSKSYTLTVNKAALTVTADDCSRMEGAANPAFTISYSGFKYNDNASSLTTQPTATTEANVSSPAGTYPITVSGGASGNYEFNYVNGTLTVIEDNQDLYIQFADATVDSLCVSNWDTNGDGKLSYEEAAAVTNLGTVFTKNTSIKTFNELQYFTGLTSIGSSAFNGCSSLTSISIPEGVISIGKSCFNMCSSLVSVNIPSSVTSIGSFAFNDCSSLSSSIIIPSNVTIIDNYTFWGCSNLTTVTISDGVKRIGSFTFGDCSNLTAINIPSSVTSIGSSAFNGCSSLSSIIIPSNVKIIDSSTFYRCSNLTSVTIPDGVTSIGLGAFHDCSCLTAIDIPSSVTSIGSSAFNGCSSLSSIIIPDGVTIIAESTFSDCSNLTSVTIFGCVTSIGENAFMNCSSLPAIDIPSSVTSIGSSAFSGCSSLSSVIIPDGVTKINSYTFRNCSALESVSFGRVLSFGSPSPFYGCSKLTSVTVGKCDPVSIYSFTFPNRANAILIVPEGSKDTYKSANYWKEFKLIVDAGDVLNTVSVENQIVEHGANTTFPVYMTNPEAITAVQFEIVLPDGVRLLDCELTDRKEDHDIQYSQLENGNYQVMIISFSSSNFKGSSGSFVNLRLGTDVVGTYRISVRNLELTTSAQTVRKPLDSSADLTICDMHLGDTNGDGHITITDAVAIVNYKLGRPSKSFVSGAADVNHDGSISITDAVIIVNWILHEETGSSAKNRDTLKFVDTIDPQ